MDDWKLSAVTVVRLEKDINMLVSLFILSLSISQCRTAVPHCCKGDAASQWEMAIFGVSELRNP